MNYLKEMEKFEEREKGRKQTENDFNVKLLREIMKEQDIFEKKFYKQALDIAKQENTQEFDAGFIMGLKQARRLLEK